MGTHDINIATDGTMRFIYSDDLRDLLDEGTCRTRRVSHVEPTPDGNWTADMSPVDGPVLGPYSLRQSALDAELYWLKEHVL